MASAPISLPIFAAVVESARSLFEKFCSAMILSMALRSITRILARLHQLFHQQIGDTLPDVLIRAEDRGNATLDRSVIKIQHRNRFFGVGGERQRRERKN